MEDPDLEEIRKRRLAQLQDSGGSDKSKEEALKAKEDAKHSILSQILDQSARARLNTLMMAKPEKAKMVENMLMRMATTGQICMKIGETELISLLESVNSQLPQNKPTVKFDRRRVALDSDDEDF